MSSCWQLGAVRKFDGSDESQGTLGITVSGETWNN